MKTDKGTLTKVSKGFRVSLPSKKGSAEHPVPEAAVCFRADDAELGIEVEVVRDDRNRIVKVTIPGKPEVTPRSAVKPDDKRGRGGGRGGPPRGGTQRGGGPARSHGTQPDRGRGGPQGQPTAVHGLPKASPQVIGSAFHNPYTFLPFGTKIHRSKPAPLTIDEAVDEAVVAAGSEAARHERFTGVLTLEVRTKSPLLTCHPTPLDPQADHKTYRALTIGDDVIVPATGVRGALRTLMTVITGGTLGYLNEHAYLVQSRDANLGPRGQRSPEHTPLNVFLAEVVTPGTAHRPGVIKLGRTKLLTWMALERCSGGRNLKRGVKSDFYVRLDERDEPAEVTRGKTDRTAWRLKLSGRPVNMKGKREGAFLPNDEHTIELPGEFWAAYAGRNAHGDRPELRRGDLIWLEPLQPDATQIRSAAEIKSIQWSRWGKRGQPLKDQIPAANHPDYLHGDRQVDEVTNLFGQLDPTTPGAVEAFAARIRPENLVFLNATKSVTRETLAPLAPPHPGCLAFYRQSDGPDGVSEKQPVKGYKVYRTTSERGADAPWLFQNQGVYGDQGELKSADQKVNKTCDLLAEDVEGTLRIAFRGLSRRELALLLQASAVPWRLGGGKPLGLGLCQIRVTNLIGEEGELLSVPGWSIGEVEGQFQVGGWESEVGEFIERVKMWVASQQPVSKLRYPRAVDDNRNKKSRGGHTWFQRHAKPRMVTQKGDASRQPGLEPLYIDGAAKDAAKSAGETLDDRTPMVAGQILPPFDPDAPLADLLYGYDVINAKTRDEQRPRRRVFLLLEPFDPSQHVTQTEKSGGNQGKNREFRQQHKLSRGKQEEKEEPGDTE